MQEKMKARAAIFERENIDDPSSGASSSTQVYTPTMIAQGLVAGRIAAFSAQSISEPTAGDSVLTQRSGTMSASSEPQPTRPLARKEQEEK